MNAQFRSHIFKIVFALGGKGTLTPLTKILRTPLYTQQGVCNRPVSVRPSVLSMYCSSGGRAGLLLRTGVCGRYRSTPTCIGAGGSAGFWLGGSMPLCRLRRRKFRKFDYEMVHSEVYLNKYVVSIVNNNHHQLEQPVITHITSPHSIQKTAFLQVFAF